MEYGIAIALIGILIYIVFKLMQAADKIDRIQKQFRSGKDDNEKIKAVPVLR